MATVKAMQVKQAGSELEAVELPVPEPGDGGVRPRVETYDRMISGAVRCRSVIEVA